MEGALVLMSWTALGMSQGALIGVDERKAVVTVDGRSWVRCRSVNWHTHRSHA